MDANLFADDLVAGEVRQDRLLGRGVDRGRLVAAFTFADDNLAGAALESREYRVDVVARRATQRQPIG